MPTVLGDGFVVTWKKPLLDRVVLGFGWLGCERLRQVGKGASGRAVRREAERRDGGSGDVRAEARILRAETRGAVGGLRAEGYEVGCWSGQTGGKAVRRLQCGADGQVLFICHDSKSISHQAVGHTSICLLSDSAADEQAVHTVYSVHKIILHLKQKGSVLKM